jgi:predicted esterase
MVCALLAPCCAVAEDIEAPVLRAEFSADDRANGLITWWLFSPVQRQTLDKATPPKNAREGEAVSDGNGNWALAIAPARFVDLKPYVNSSSGMMWASARVESAAGGARLLKGGTYCALKIFVDGKLILNKPQPAGPFLDEASAQIDLPKGTCEIVVGVGIRSGYCGFHLTLTENVKAPTAHAVAGDAIVIPVAKGKAPDVGAAALRAMAFVTRDTFVKSGDKIPIVAGFGGSLPAASGPISGQFFTPDGKPVGQPLPARSFLDLSRQYWQREYVVPADAGLVTELSLEVKSGETVIGRKKLELYSLQKLGTEALALEREIQSRAEKAGRALPGAALAVEKLKLFVAKIEAGEERVSNELGMNLVRMVGEARRCAEIEEKGADPWAGKSGYFERAYQSKIDESPQPYFVNVPSAALADQTKTQKFPLVIFLHGYVPSYDKHHWWDEMPDFNALFEKHSAFLALPFGRSNTDFQSCGEEDVLDVIAEMKHAYPIDEDRVYLYGYSMGGMAVYHIAGHHPDLFAGCIVLAGRADSPLQNHRPLDQFHLFKQWLIHADNPISLCENFVNIPLRLYHGLNDFIISADEAKRMEKRFKELGCEAQLNLVNGDHLSLFETMVTEEPLTWLLQQKRKPNPEKAHLKSYSLRYASYSGVKVPAISGEMKPIEVAWTRAGDKNQYSIGGELVVDPKTLDTSLRKTPQRCGPVREAICGPFLIAYGTSGTPEANTKNKKHGERLAQEWQAFTRSAAILKADKDVSDAEKKSKNLFLVGEEQENSIHAAIAKSLPIAVKDGKVSIGDKSVPLQNHGVIYTYPSPLAPPDGSQVVVICTGVQYGKDIGANHKFDLLPDFLIYDESTGSDGTGTNSPICGGFFDGQWKLNSKTTWWFDKN